MSVYMVTDENGFPLTEPGVAGSETVATEDIEVKPTHQNENQNENQT